MKGRFAWYELLSTDTEAAVDFYTDVMGWKTERFGEASEASPYTLWVGSQGPLGGVMKLPEEAAKEGAPPHWMAYVEVDDIEATVAKVTEMGGKIYVQPTVIPKVGRFSVIADPQGASLAVLEPEPQAEPMPPHDRSRPGEPIWSELYADDGAAALEFYSALFGWEKKQELDMGEAGTYTIFGRGDDQYGGMMTKPAKMTMPPSWLYYIHVDDLDAAIERANAKGAKTLIGPTEVPGGDRVAQLTDPQGATFALHGPAPAPT